MKQKKKAAKGKGYYILLSYASIIIFYILIDRFGVINGLKIYTLGLLVWVMWRVYTARDMILLNMRILEAGLFGKSLDKENWKSGELARVKTKLVYKKNDRQKAKD